MKRLVLILFLVSMCYGTPFYLLDTTYADIYTSHQLPVTDSTLDVGSVDLFWHFFYGNAFTDGMAYWESNDLYGFNSITGTTITDGVLTINSGSITLAVDGTFTGTLTGTTLTDGTFIVTGGIITGATWNGVAIDISDYTNLVAGTNITLVDDILNVDDAFLINDGDDTTTGTITAAGFTTAGTTNTSVLIVDTPTLVANLAGYTDKVGIGTVTPGTPGYAKLHIKGTNANAAGPHIIFETDADAYPIMQIFPWSHDNMAIGFDSYYDGTHKSSDAGSNFRIQKSADTLLFRYDSGIAQGNAITWNDAINIDLVTGEVDIDTPVIGSNPPANITSAGTAGTVTYDADFLYVCIANNSWKRVALTTAGWGVTGDTMIYEDANTMIFEDGNTMVYD